METMNKYELMTEKFFKRRFPEKDIQSEIDCGYFGEWVERFKSKHPEEFMDEESLKIWEEIKNE
jgi:hypothetical protein